MTIIIIFSLIVLLFSVVIHEVAHGSVAYYLGDPTAKYAGRLTLNPLKHLDPFGSVILPLLLLIIRSPILFGYAKPVPINPYNFRDQKWGSLKVAIAGPAANFSIAIIFGLSIRFLNLPEQLASFFLLITFYNILLGLFNLVPIPPLDGSWILFTFLPERWSNAKIFLQRYGFFILILFFFLGGLNVLFAAIEKLSRLITGI